MSKIPYLWLICCGILSAAILIMISMDPHSLIGLAILGAFVVVVYYLNKWGLW